MVCFGFLGKNNHIISMVRSKFRDLLFVVSNVRTYSTKLTFKLKSILNTPYYALHNRWPWMTQLYYSHMVVTYRIGWKNKTNEHSNKNYFCTEYKIVIMLYTYSRLNAPRTDSFFIFKTLRNWLRLIPSGNKKPIGRVRCVCFRCL